jgi:NTE family protein
MHKVLALISFLAFLTCSLGAQDGSAVARTGLTLSGGGAKGLAHIGVLKAIDSAGIKIDYVTGTSTGSIIGGLYAIGFSGKEIEQMARAIDWDMLLSNQINLRSIAMEEKDRYGLYAIEVPFEDGSFRGRTGALESQELWLKLSELFFPVYREKNFDQFKRPFRAVATDIATGEPYILAKGELITALRASMAIPAVFTAIEIEGRRLVDGGIVRNLPVSEAKQMGADFVIASNVSEGMYSKEQLTNPIQILTQIAFLKEAEDHKRQIARSDFYANQELSPFSTGSFDKSLAIIDSGIVYGNSLVPQLKNLADSLGIEDRLRGTSGSEALADSVFIVSAQVEGLEKESAISFLKGLKFEDAQYYTPARISGLIRRTFGNLEYEWIRYRLVPAEPGKAIIVFEVKERPLALARASIHFNTFAGLSAIGSFTQRNIFPNSKTSLSLNFGENSRFRVEHLQYLDRASRVALVSELQTESFEIVRYDNFQPDELYRLFNSKWDNRLQLGSRRQFTAGVGNRFERIRFTPFTQPVIEFDGMNNFFATYAFGHLNTLDRSIFPRKGVRLYSEMRLIHNQQQRIRYYDESDRQIEPATPLLLQEADYFQGYLQLEWYKQLSKQHTFSGLLQAGFSTNSLADIFNAFNIGGINRLYRNQIVFPGVPHFGTRANNVAALQLNLRKEFYNNLYLTISANGMATDYLLPENGEQAERAYILGQSLSIAYDSLMGPISFSVMYSGKFNKIEPYVNIGFVF